MIAELVVVMARVPKHERGPGGITAFIVESDSPGITVERRNAFMGLKGIENGLTRFEQGAGAGGEPCSPGKGTASRSL